MREVEDTYLGDDAEYVTKKKIVKRKETQELDYTDKRHEKAKDLERRKGEFRCINCQEMVSTGGRIGTEHRNHCPSCLWSQHVDLEKSGDRKSDCKAPMEPIGLTFKHEGLDKWGKPRQGELMLIHRCVQGDKVSINRIAADDNPQLIEKIFEASRTLGPEDREVLEGEGIRLLSESDEDQIFTQLYGKNYKERQAHQ